MKVEDCKKCKKYMRKVWSSYYVPQNYHPIGRNYAYAWCKLHRKRCREVKDCDVIPRGQLEMKFDTEKGDADMFGRKKKDARPKWIVYNYGDEEFEFAECSGCGYEVEKYMGLMFCPKCQKMMDGTVLAEEIEKTERD